MCGVERIQPISEQAFAMIQGCTQSYYGVWNPIWLQQSESTFRYGYMTIDGGTTWHSWLATGNEYFVNENTGWQTLPSESGGLSELQRSDDGGRSWATIRHVAWEDASFDFVSVRVGWVIGSVGGQTGLAYTSDGGSNWTVMDPVIAP
jgi:photosystem II stability/assembly factor-like uncharacterized protein